MLSFISYLFRFFFLCFQEMCQPHAPQRVRADRFTKRAVFRCSGVHFAEDSPFIGGAGDDLPCDCIEMLCFQIAQEGMSVRCLKRAPVIFIRESVIGRKPVLRCAARYNRKPSLSSCAANLW